MTLLSSLFFVFRDAHVPSSLSLAPHLPGFIPYLFTTFWSSFPSEMVQSPYWDFRRRPHFLLLCSGMTIEKACEWWSIQTSGYSQRDGASRHLNTPRVMQGSLQPTGSERQQFQKAYFKTNGCAQFLRKEYPSPAFQSPQRHWSKAYGQAYTPQQPTSSALSLNVPATRAVVCAPTTTDQAFLGWEQLVSGNGQMCECLRSLRSAQAFTS